MVPMMSTGAYRFIVRWFTGTALGTLIFGVTSPLFVRSYVALEPDPLRGGFTMPPGSHYRWRNEGYATTAIGPHGMRGKTELPRSGDRSLQVALWGDSQAEGVCLSDDAKLFAQAERLFERRGRSLAVLPFARSGEDAASWLPQMPRVEPEFSIQAHVLLVVDLPDLVATAEVGDEVVALGDGPARRAGRTVSDRAVFVRVLPDFVIHGARRLLTEADGNTPRRLRFAPGPVRKSVAESAEATVEFDWPAIMGGIRATTELPVVILYAPPIPLIVDGRLVRAAPHAEQVDAMRAAAESKGITLVDLRSRLLRSAQEGAFPHGFHNGQIGVGHLNADGYRILAAALVDTLREIIPPEPSRND